MDLVVGVGTGAAVLALRDQKTMRRIIRGYPEVGVGTFGAPERMCSCFLQKGSQSFTFGPKAQKTKKL